MDGFAVFSYGPAFRVYITSKDTTKGYSLALKVSSVGFIFQKNPDSLQKKTFLDTPFSEVFKKAPDESIVEDSRTGSLVAASILSQTGGVSFSALSEPFPDLFAGGNEGIIGGCNLILAHSVILDSFETTPSMSSAFDLSTIRLFVEGEEVLGTSAKISQGKIVLTLPKEFVLDAGEYQMLVTAKCGDKNITSLDFIQLVFSPAQFKIFSLSSGEQIYGESKTFTSPKVLLRSQGSLILSSSITTDIKSQSVISGEFFPALTFVLKTDQKESEEILSMTISSYNSSENVSNFVSDSYVTCGDKINAGPTIDGSNIVLHPTGLKIGKTDEKTCEVWLKMKNNFTTGGNLKFILGKVEYQGVESLLKKEVTTSGIITKDNLFYASTRLAVNVPMSG